MSGIHKSLFINHKSKRLFKTLIFLILLAGILTAASSWLARPVQADSLISLDEGYGTTTNDTNSNITGTFGSSSSNVSLEQQINILDREFSTNGSNQPTDNSLGLIKWEPTKFNGETVYFEAVAYCSSCSGGNARAVVTLYTSAGSAVSSSAINTSASSYTRIRTASAITADLSDGTQYTVRLSLDATSGTAYLKAARLIVVQSGSSITDTQTQIELGDYECNNGQKFCYGEETEKVYNTGETHYNSVVALSSTSFVVAYTDSGNSNYGTAVVGKISGTTISYGSEYAFNSATTTYISAALLSSTSFVVSYIDGGNSNYGTAIVGTVSDTVISYGSEYAFKSASTSYPSTTALSSTSIAIAYASVGIGYSKIGTISGTTISYGSEYTFESSSAPTLTSKSASTLSSSSFVIAYGSASTGVAIVGTVSGTVITFGSKYTFESNNTTEISALGLSSSVFVIGYQDLSSSTGGSAIMGSVSGTTITYGSEFTFETNPSTNDPSITALSSTSFIITYTDVTNSNYGTAIIGTVSGTNIVFDTKYAFHSGTTYTTSVAALSSTSFVATYEDNSNSNYGTAVVIRAPTAGLSTTTSTEYVFNSATTQYTSVSNLSSTAFVAVYQDAGNSSYGTAVIGTVSGTTISYGSEYVFNSGTSIYTLVSALSSTAFVVTYTDSSNSSYGTAVIGTVSGTTISFGSEYVFNSATTSNTSVSALSSTAFVVVYRDNGNSSYGTAMIGTVSGTTISYGSEYVFNSATTGDPSVSALSSTAFVTTYYDGGSSSYGTAIIGTVSGTTISYGSEYVFNSAASTYTSVSALSSTAFVAVYQDTGNSSYGTAVVGIVSDTSISYGSEYVFNSATSQYTSVSALSSTAFVVAYRDDGNSYYGTAVIGTISGTTITYGSEYVFHSGTSDNDSVKNLSSTTFVSVYDGDSDYGNAIVGNLASLGYPKYYSYDNSKFSGTKNAYLEATLKATPNTLSSGPNYVSSSGDCVEVANADAFATQSWTNPGNASSNNTSYATVSVDGNASEYLKCTNFGFNLPSNATVKGIKVEVEVFSSSTGNGGSSRYKTGIVKGGVIGTVTYDYVAFGTAANVLSTYGSEIDLFDETWTYSDINASNFGFVFSAQKFSGAGAAHTVSVDVIRMTVYYETPTTVTAQLFNKTDGVVVTNSDITSSSTSWSRVRSSSALSTGWDTSNADEYEFQVYGSNPLASALVSDAKIIIEQTGSPITSLETVQTYNNTYASDSDSTYTSQGFPNRLDKTNWSGGSYTAYFESDLKTSSGSNAYYAQLDYGGGTGQVTASDTSLTRKRSSDIWSSLPSSATDIDVQLKNASTSTTTSNNSQLIIQASSMTGGGAGTNPAWKTSELCKKDKCLYFAGTSYVSFGDDSDLDFTAAAEFTIEGWFRTPNITSGQRTLVAKHNATAGGYKVYMDSNGYLTFGVDDDSAWTPDDSVSTSPTAFDDNQWHFFTAVKSGTSSITIYVDGQQYEQDTSIAAIGTLANSDTFYLGIDGDGSSNGYSGFLDEIKVYGTSARTAAQVKTDYIGETPSRGTSASFGPDTSFLSQGLVGYWKMDESSGNYTDSSGNGNTGTKSSGSYSTGKFGNGFGTTNANSTADVTTVTDPASGILDFSNTQSFSYGLWLKISATETASEIFPFTKGALNSSFVGYALNIPKSGAGNIGCSYTDGNGSGLDTAIGADTTGYWDDKWHFYTCVVDRSSGKMMIYIDGALSGTDSDLTEGSAASNSYDLEIGEDHDVREFTGALDEVRVYNRALSPAEIQKLYNWAPGPVGWWKMDENNGASTYDSSGNSLTGTITNALWTTGKIGSALTTKNANSIREYTSISDNDVLDFTNTQPFTFSAWIKASPTMEGSGGELINKGGTDLSTKGYDLSMTSTSFACGYIDGNGSGNDAATASYTPDNNWHYITCLMDRNGTATGTVGLYTYIDGVLYGRDTSLTEGDGGTGNSSALVIGEHSSSYEYSASIDDVKIYNYARTPAQIVEDMNGGHPAPGSPVGSPVVWYKFDEGYSTTLNNAGNYGSSANATVSGTLWDTNGKFGFSQRFKGSAAYISSPVLALLAGNSATYNTLSWGGWFKPTSSAASKTFIIKKNEFRLTTDSSSRPNCSIYSGSWQTAAVGITALPLNSWSHILCTYDGSNIHVYVNGIEAGGPVSQTGNLTSSNTTGLNLGWNFAGGEYFQGLMDEIKVYNLALTSDQVKEELNQGKANVMGSLSDTSGLSGGGVASNSASAAFCVPGSTDPCTPPVAFWKLDENTGTNTYDSSGNGNNSTTWTEATWTAGKFGSGVSFNGNNQVVRMAETTSTDLGATTDSYTVSAWINTTYNYTGWGSIVAKLVSTNYPFAMSLSPGNYAQFAIYSDMVQSYVSGDTALNDGKWHLITGVRNVSTDKVSIYVDGRLNQELPDDTISSMKNDDDISIGNSGASYNEYDFTGMIDDVRIYNYARTPAQIQWDYNRGKPMAWYKFDENTGSTTYDSSGNGYTNDALNGATYTTGKYSYALNFDGTNDYVTIPDTSSAGIDVGDTTSSYSVSAWFKTSTNFSASATLVAKDNGSGVYPYALQINSSEQPCLVMNDGSTRTLCGSSNVSDGSWHLMTAVRDVSADTLTLYIDGQRVNYMTDPTTATMQNNDKTSIGCSGTSYSANDYTGQIDDVQIYNYPLTATQVKLLYNQNSTARF